jgi:hypothetical protein
MRILEVATNIWHEVTIEEISPKEFKYITAKRYFFKWKEVAKEAAVYGLRIEGNNDIKGLMALVDIPSECRIEIKLLTASRENLVFGPEKGIKIKEFEGIVGALIAFAGAMQF